MRQDGSNSLAIKKEHCCFSREPKFSSEDPHQTDNNQL